MRTVLAPVVIFVLCVAAAVAQPSVPAPAFFDVKYDTSADPFTQLNAAKTIAQKAGKKILLDVGGEWCSWCHRLDQLFRSNPDLAEYLDRHYVPVKVNFSLTNKNEKFLSQYPQIEGYPHLFVLDATGKLLHSQDTGQLEEGKGHSKTKVMEFLKTWAEK